VLKKAAERAGISKPTNPHAFRHGRATWAANKLSDQQLKAFFGWTGGSRMAETYVALSGRDLDDAWLQANGQPIPVQHEPVLKAIPCPKCKYENPTTASYCQRCGAPLDVSIAMKMEEAEKVALSTAVKPDDIQFLVKQLVSLELEKRKKGK
jgi:hypothetical protein